MHTIGRITKQQSVIRDPRPWKLCWFLAVGVAASSIVLLPGSVNAQWWDRTVTAVSGSFGTLSPHSGYEVGEGTSHIEWGVAVEGSFVSYLTWQGYDAFPGVDQPWFSPGQTVQPGQRFLAGYLTFRNGEVTVASSASDLNVDLNAYVFGSEFYIDNHPLTVPDTWRVSIRQTENFGVSQLADADYVYFPEFPRLGSFRVFEELSTRVPVYAEFGSLEPVAFGEVLDPSAGAVVKSVIDDPAPRGTTTIITGGTGTVSGVFSSHGGGEPISGVTVAVFPSPPDLNVTIGNVWAGPDPFDPTQWIVSADVTSTSIGPNSIFCDVTGSIWIEISPGEWMQMLVPVGMVEIPWNVLDHSAAAFGDGTNVLNLDFGDIQADSGMHSLTYHIKNLLAEYRAGLDLDGTTEVSDPGEVFSTNPAGFQNLAPGELSSFFNVFLQSSTPGHFSGQYRFDLSDEKDLSGHAGAQVLTLNVTANVVPEPSTLVLLSIGALALTVGWWRRRWTA